MSKSKVGYRLRKRFEPHIESHGFKKSAHPREYVQVYKNVLCAVHVQVMGPDHGFPDEHLADGSFSIEVGVTYPQGPAGLSDLVENAESYGAGTSEVRAMLTRTSGTGTFPRAVVWELNDLTPDEAIADAIEAFDSQALPFFENWTDYEWAWNALHDTETEFQWAQRVPAEGAGRLYLDKYGNGPSTLRAMAAHLGWVDEEIAATKQFKELHGGLTDCDQQHLDQLISKQT